MNFDFKERLKDKYLDLSHINFSIDRPNISDLVTFLKNQEIKSITLCFSWKINEALEKIVEHCKELT
uniref:hypothetical protein n=1 Tax=Wolbachia endosymbiont of Pentidionis agamae TaxID=3110435 RepID=UPI002FD7128C